MQKDTIHSFLKGRQFLKTAVATVWRETVWISILSDQTKYLRGICIVDTVKNDGCKICSKKNLYYKILGLAKLAHSDIC